jgi:hypothetical protein
MTSYCFLYARHRNRAPHFLLCWHSHYDLVATLRLRYQIGVVDTQVQTGRSAKEINSHMVELASTTRFTFKGYILTCGRDKCIRVATNILGHPTFHFLIRHYVRINHQWWAGRFLVSPGILQIILNKRVTPYALFKQIRSGVVGRKPNNVSSILVLSLGNDYGLHIKRPAHFIFNV